ncbi:hypothetical protein BPOR_0493g00060 [Botrytis porri]|uniref:Uncharacterized protein n=1 Tax=Botrytis porri TaxID=87229 RepID=A0A4Z1KRG0_9HELO|nr:hypothetical protein BPOR_0493g00060 [Botrytis porri]
MSWEFGSNILKLSVKDNIQTMERIHAAVLSTKKKELEGLTNERHSKSMNHQAYSYYCYRILHQRAKANMENPAVLRHSFDMQAKSLSQATSGKD